MAVSINPNYANISSAGIGSKLYVPVTPSKLIYSNFDHVSGFAAKNGQNGVSISKIQILNTLIEHLISIKSGKQISALKNANPEQIDSLIDNYQTQIKQAVQAAQTSQYGLAGVRPEPGALFSINA